MNRDFETTSKRTRIAGVLVAVLCTVLIGSGIDGLAGYLQNGKTQLALQGSTIAQR